MFGLSIPLQSASLLGPVPTFPVLINGFIFEKGFEFRLTASGHSKWDAEQRSVLCPLNAKNKRSNALAIIRDCFIAGRPEFNGVTGLDLWPTQRCVRV